MIWVASRPWQRPRYLPSGGFPLAARFVVWRIKRYGFGVIASAALEDGASPEADRSVLLRSTCCRMFAEFDQPMLWQHRCCPSNGMPDGLPRHGKSIPNQAAVSNQEGQPPRRDVRCCHPSKRRPSRTHSLRRLIRTAMSRGQTESRKVTFQDRIGRSQFANRKFRQAKSRTKRT